MYSYPTQDEVYETFVGAIKNNEIGTIYDLLTNAKTKLTMSNLSRDCEEEYDIENGILLDSSIELLTIFCKYSKNPNVYPSDETIDGLFDGKNYDRLNIIYKSRFRDSFIDYVKKYEQLDYLYNNGIIDNDDIYELAASKFDVLKYANSKGIDIDYDGLLIKNLNQHFHSDCRATILLAKCSYPNDKLYNDILKSDVYSKYVYILLDRGMYPSPSIFARYVSLLESLMNCYDAYPLHEIYATVPQDKWYLIQKNKMILIHNYRQFSQMMSDIVVHTMTQ